MEDRAWWKDIKEVGAIIMKGCTECYQPIMGGSKVVHVKYGQFRLVCDHCYQTLKAKR